MIDQAMGFELVDDWLPDFIAVAENPTHVNAEALRAQARARVIESYAAVTTSGGHQITDVVLAAQCDDVLVILEATAQWVVANRTTLDSGSSD